MRFIGKHSYPCNGASLRGCIFILIYGQFAMGKSIGRFRSTDLFLLPNSLETKLNASPSVRFSANKNEQMNRKQMSERCCSIFYSLNPELGMRQSSSNDIPSSTYQPNDQRVDQSNRSRESNRIRSKTLSSKKRQTKAKRKIKTHQENVQTGSQTFNLLLCFFLSFSLLI